MTRVLDRVQDLEHEGYQFEAAEASFVLLVDPDGVSTPTTSSGVPLRVTD